MPHQRAHSHATPTCTQSCHSNVHTCAARMHALRNKHVVACMYCTSRVVLQDALRTHTHAHTHTHTHIGTHATHLCPVRVCRVVLQDALRTLYLLDALNDSGNVTDTGRAMAVLPLEPGLARCLLAAVELRYVRVCVCVHVRVCVSPCVVVSLCVCVCVCALFAGAVRKVVCNLHVQVSARSTLSRGNAFKRTHL